MGRARIVAGISKSVTQRMSRDSDRRADRRSDHQAPYDAGDLLCVAKLPAQNSA
jgi:hypothetical protein